MEISRGHCLVSFRSLLCRLEASIYGELTQPDSRLNQVAGSSTPPSLCGLSRPYYSMAPYLKMNRRDPWPSVNQESTPRNNWWAPCLWRDTRPGMFPHLTSLFWNTLSWLLEFTYQFWLFLPGFFIDFNQQMSSKCWLFKSDTDPRC